MFCVYRPTVYPCIGTVYFRHFSTEILTFKEIIFLIICWTERSDFRDGRHGLVISGSRQGIHGEFIYIVREHYLYKYEKNTRSLLCVRKTSEHV